MNEQENHYSLNLYFSYRPEVKVFFENFVCCLFHYLQAIAQ